MFVISQVESLGLVNMFDLEFHKTVNTVNPL